MKKNSLVIVQSFTQACMAHKIRIQEPQSLLNYALGLKLLQFRVTT